ncbi:MAG: flagellar motor protein MotB [Oscillospiraceae bacterium]
MARKKQESPEEGAYWMDTYGDMVTLLLTFFVLLFAMSSVDQAKWEVFVKAIQGQFSSQDQFVIVTTSEFEEEGSEDLNPTGEDPVIGISEEEVALENIENFEDLYMFLKKYVEKEGLTDSVSMYNGNGYTYIEFKNSIFFDGNSSVLLKEGQEILSVVSSAINQLEPKIQEVHSHGHTAQDQSDRENTASIDRNLSSSRAANVITFIQEHTDITGDRLASTGHGQWKPLFPHDGTEETRRKNRRCELVIAEVGNQTPSLSEIYEIINNPEKYEHLKDNSQIKQNELIDSLLPSEITDEVSTSSSAEPDDELSVESDVTSDVQDSVSSTEGEDTSSME